MQWLAVQVISGADPDFMDTMHNHGFTYYSLWLVFIFLGQLTVMNMMIGVVCNAVDDTTESILQNEFLKHVTLQVKDVISRMDVDQSGYVSKDEFTELLQNKDVSKMLHEVGVDLSGAQEFFEGIYSGVDELPISDVLDMVVQFRHSKPSTVKDLLVLRRMMQMEMGQFEDRLWHSLGITPVVAQDGPLSPGATN